MSGCGKCIFASFPYPKHRTTSMTIPFFLLLLVAGSLTFQVPTASTTSSPLRIGFYRSSCPQAEQIVRKAVNRAISRNPGLGAGLIRMHFHDCFVRGCDGSVLIDSTPTNSAEKDSIANAKSLRGFEVIDEAKAKIESICPQRVFCSDILAFAARDSTFKLGGITYQVPSGRRDGRISHQAEATNNLPGPFFNLQQLKKRFAIKGLSTEEMVVLSGAHSIGSAHCSSFSDRLYSFNSTNAPDTSMNSGFVVALKRRCTSPTNNPNPLVAQDMLTPNRLDSKYYQDVENGRALFTSDNALKSSRGTRRLVKSFARSNGLWAYKFTKSMVKMGSIEVLTGHNGEIRKNCRVRN